MSGKNKFGFAPLETKSAAPRRERAPGPMGAAVRDAAETLQDSTEAKVEQRRKNALDAKAFRAAQSEGRVLQNIPLDDVLTSDLPRDRLELDAVASSDEMEELKASIRARGQKEPIEVYRDADGALQLKKGWRRLTALRQLFSESGDEAFAHVVARIDERAGGRLAHYIDMVEENVVREDLTFAEMAQVAITAAADDAVGEPDPAEMVNRLYAALHKTKRSYIRSFVFLLTALEEGIQWPREVSRNLGVDVARALNTAAQADELRAELRECESPDDQNRVLKAFLDNAKEAPVKKVQLKAPREKFEFFVGDTKVTARDGEVRLVSEKDFATIPKARLQKAVEAFEAALKGDPRIRSL